jgi:hypothetical protein
MCTTCDEVRAIFSPPGQRPIRCGRCRLRGDVNVVSRICSGCPKYATFGPIGGRAHRCNDCRIKGDVDGLNDVCITCLAVSASYGSTSEGPRRCFGCKLPGDVNKHKRLCRTCFKNKSEFGPTPRKKPTTCESCKIPGQLHRDSGWLWNMLVTRKPRKGRKRYKILWSDETLRDQLWWLKPRKTVKPEIKEEPVGGDANNTVSSSSSSSAPSASSSSSSAAAPRPQVEVQVKIEPGAEGDAVIRAGS